MNPRVAHVAIVIVGVACAAFLAFLIASGCAAHAALVEPEITVTVAANARDR